MIKRVKYHRARVFASNIGIIIYQSLNSVKLVTTICVYIQTIKPVRIKQPPSLIMSNIVDVYVSVSVCIYFNT